MFEILLPVTGSTASQLAVPHALAMARLFGAHVHIARVLEGTPPNDAYGAGSLGGGSASDRPVDPVEWHFERSEAQAGLNRLTEPFVAAGVSVEAVLLEGRTSDQLVQYAAQHQIGLVVQVGGHARGSYGATCAELLFDAHVSQLLVRPSARRQPAADPATPVTAVPASYHKVLTGLDGSMRAEVVLSWVKLIAEQYGSEVVLGHVVVEPTLPRLTPPTEEDLELVERLNARNRAEAETYLKSAAERLTARTRVELLDGRKVAAALHDLAAREKPDLVVLSAHGYSGESRWPYGDVATSFIEYGDAPLLVVQDMVQPGREAGWPADEAVRPAR